MNVKRVLKKVRWFIWEDDSLLSWVVNIILAFVIVKFIFFPGLGLILSTDLPIVAVVSGSMEHSEGFDKWWDKNSDWYGDRGISKDDFLDYPFKNGFNKGDLMILIGTDTDDIKIGQIIVFKGSTRDPIIHRVISKNIENNIYYFRTKGDNNRDSFGALGEDKIHQDNVFGRAVIRIPVLGWVKIIFTSLIGG